MYLSKTGNIMQSLDYLMKNYADSILSYTIKEIKDLIGSDPEATVILDYLKELTARIQEFVTPKEGASEVATPMGGRVEVNKKSQCRDNMRMLVQFAEGNSYAPIVCFDPTVNREITYAIAYGFVEQQPNAKYKLTDRGQRLIEQIKVVGDLMTIEINDLNILAKKLTENKVNEIVDRWRAKDA
jgi:hypothetical protein